MKKIFATVLVFFIMTMIIIAGVYDKPCIRGNQLKQLIVSSEKITLNLIKLIEVSNCSAYVFICNITPDKYMEFVLNAYNYSSKSEEIIALSHDGEILWIYKPNISEFTLGLTNIREIFAFLYIDDIDDIDNDNLDEFLITLNIFVIYYPNPWSEGKARDLEIHQIIDDNGSLLWRICIFNASDVIPGGWFFWSYDLDGDGHKEILLGNYYNITCYDAITHEVEWVLNISFQNVGWPPIIDDINNDGKMDLIIANGYEPIFAIQGDGKILWIQSERVRENETYLLVYNRMLGDFTGDKKKDLLVWGMIPYVFKIVDAETGKVVYKIEPNYLQNLTYWRLIKLVEFPGVGLDVNNDGVLELISYVAWRYSGVKLYNWTCISFRNKKLHVLWRSSPVRMWMDTEFAFGDIDGDGRMEIILYPAWCVSLYENFSALKGLVIINAEDGSLLKQYNLSEFDDVFEVGFYHAVECENIQVADIDGDERSELILGFTSIWSSNISDWYSHLNETTVNACIAIFEMSPAGFGSPWVNNVELLSVINKEATNTFLDSDYDGLPNYLEPYYNASMQDNDSDHDKIPDGWEVFYGLNPANSSDSLVDSDNDGLSNFKEFKYGTNPRNPDTDGDGILDGWEITYGLNPVNRLDAFLDFDHDGLSNYEEFVFGTNPLNPDTDGDGFSDFVEITSFSNPLDSGDFPVIGLSIRSWIVMLIIISSVLAIYNVCIHFELKQLGSSS